MFLTISILGGWLDGHRGIAAALVLLAALLAVAAVLYVADRLCRRNDGAEAEPEAQHESAAADAGCTDACCGLNEVCPSQMILDGESGRCEVVYYDDEELDAYGARDAADYTPAEVDQFRDVLYTLLPADLMGWQRSLKRRGIVMPQPIHDEFIMLYNERHSAVASAQ